MTSFAHRIRNRAALSTLLLATVAACEGTPIVETGPSVATVISSVSTPTGAAASFTPGRVPVAASGAAFAVSAPPAAVVGGTALYTLQSATPFSQALVTIEGFEGYYRVDLPTAATTADILVTFRQEQMYFTYNLQFNGVEPGGAQGRPAFARTRLVSVGTGDVQVSVFFDDTSDVDLYVVDPTGEEIFYGHRQGVYGELDLDANAGCAQNVPLVNNENITFATGRAPRGTYRVRLNYWSSCGVPRTKYVVTVAVKGQPVQIFTGQLTGVGTGGGPGAGQPITTFTY